MHISPAPHRSRWWLAAGALLAVLAAGCLRVDADLSIERGTVNGTVVTAVETAAAEQLGIEAGNLFEEQTSGLGGLAGVTTEEYDEGGWAGTRLVFDRVLIEDLNALSEDDPEGLRIIHDDPAGTYEYRQVLDFTWLGELDSEQLGTPAPGADVAALLETFDVTIAVTFPGEVIEHNGELAGTTVTWTAQPGERTDLRAVAQADEVPGGSTGGTRSPDAAAGEPDQPGSGWAGSAALAAGLVLAALAAAGGLVAAWLVSRARRNRSAGPDVP